MILTKGIIKADLIAASHAIEVFEEKHIRDIKNIAAYHLQQAVEKLIKNPDIRKLQQCEQ